MCLYGSSQGYAEQCVVTSSVLTTLMNRTKIQSAVAVWDGRLNAPLTDWRFQSTVFESLYQEGSVAIPFNGSVIKTQPKHSETRKGIYRDTANNGWDFCMWQMAPHM